MEKEKFLLPKKITLLIFFVFSFTYNATFSQCTNPTPTGDTSQVFCKSDNSPISNLTATGGTVVWYDAPSGGELYDETEFLVNGVTYYADDISGSNCSINRLAVTVAIYGDFPTNVDVSVGKCAIDNPTIGDLSAIGENIAWYDAQFGGNLLPLSQLLESGKTYWVQQTQNGCTSDRFPTTVSLIDPITPTTAPIQSFCYPPNPTVANLKSSGTSVLWYDTETSTTPLKTTTPLINGEDYWVVEVDFPCVSSNRAQTTVVLDAAPDAGESSSLEECEESFVTTNLFNLLGGTPDTTGAWTGPSELSNGYLGTFDPGINTVGTYTYTVSSILGMCPAESATVSVIFTVVPPPTTSNANQSFCIKDYLPNAPIISDLNASGTSILWYAGETSATPLNSTDLLIDGATYWATQTIVTTGCESTNRLAINVSIINPATPTTTTVNQAFCAAVKPTVASLQATGTSINWYANETSSMPLNSAVLLINGEDYWAAGSDASTGCESIDRLKVIVSVTDVAPATINQVAQTFCESDFPTISNLAATGNGILWYATETSTEPLANTSLLINGTTYWAVQTNATAGCESSVRVVANVTLTAISTPTLISLGNEFCKIDNPTIADLNLNVTVNNGGTISWYNAYPNGNLLNASTALVDGKTYYAIETNANGCKSINPLEVTITLEACDEYDIEIYDGFSPTGNGINDTFKIKNLRELYPDFKVEFFNRWGNLMYTANAGNSDWNGRLNGDGELSPTGVYFFVIYFNKNDRKPIQRSLYLSR